MHFRRISQTITVLSSSLHQRVDQRIAAIFPIVNRLDQLVGEILPNIAQWRKDMIHYIKDENPEINTAIIEIAQKTNLDPKAVATGAYMVYKLLENESDELPFEEDAE